jgi:predicted DNA-binding transcriptional regulator AlpA
LTRKRNVTEASGLLVNIQQLRSIVPIAESTLARWIKAGLFPAPVCAIDRPGYARLWRRTDVDAWIAKKAAK